jgi:hypothetical protein
VPSGADVPRSVEDAAVRGEVLRATRRYGKKE